MVEGPALEVPVNVIASGVGKSGGNDGVPLMAGALGQPAGRFPPAPASRPWSLSLSEHAAVIATTINRSTASRFIPPPTAGATGYPVCRITGSVDESASSLTGDRKSTRL